MSYVDETRVISLEIEISKIKTEKRKEEVIVMNFDIKKKNMKKKRRNSRIYEKDR
jgi:hypothetical protein